MRQISFQNRSIEFEFVRLDRFCCPEALTIAVQYLCAVLLFSFFFLWGAIKCDQGAIFRKNIHTKRNLGALLRVTVAGSVDRFSFCF